MRFYGVILAITFLLCVHDVVDATKKEDLLSKDDKAFWNRYLTSNYDVASTAAPTPRPTSPPTIAPIPQTTPPVEPTNPPTLGPPTTAPMPSPEACEVDVLLSCTVTDNPEASCETIDRVTELQCVGCTPTALCFTYTGFSCPDILPPVMSSCDDFNGGPQAMADIIISDGNVVLVETMVKLGAEICLTNGGAELPTQLSVFINVAMGGENPEALQVSTIDSSCSGSQGLTLLRSYGALNLVHFINDCQGDNDCFIPITYEYLVSNQGAIGLTITDLERTLNGDPFDLLDGVNPDDLYLMEGEAYSVSEDAVAECCTAVDLENVVTVISVSDDGVICEDNDMFNLTKPILTPSPSTEPSSTPTSLPTIPAITSPPISPPVVPETFAPVSPPTFVPVAPETFAPVTKATFAPVAPPTFTPVAPPTFAPVAPSTFAPVAPPTSAPVAPPTFAPLAPPTLTPLAPPTVAPAAPPSLAPIVPPTIGPVALPTFVPVAPPPFATFPPDTLAPAVPSPLAPVIFSLEPTPLVSAFPTLAPAVPSTLAPVTTPPIVPTPLVAPPTFAPVVPTTFGPVISSPVPTPITSAFPSLPVDLCFVQVQVTCTPPEGFEDCNSIIEFRAECFEKPYSMGFRFNGGDCTQEFNEQDPQIYQCEDYGGGPPINAGEEAYFVVSDIKGLGVRYFEGPVPVGGFLTMANPNPNLQLDANVNITIYNSPNTTRENILQTMIVHTSCSQVTFLKDRYGSIELLWFNNTVQGNVSCAVDLELGFSIENIAEGFNAILSSLTSITNFPGNEFVNLTEQVSGQTLQPGQSIPFRFGVSLDTSIRQRYTAFSTIQGSSPEGFSCRSTDFLNFTAGNTNAAPFFSISQPPVAAPFGF